MNNTDKQTIIGKILEIRTTGDGDYDYDCNCWECKSVLIITDKGKYAFAGDDRDENNDYCMKSVEIPDNFEQKYPFILHRYSPNEISMREETYNDKGNLTDIELNYEDVLLWISGNYSGNMYCSVHDLCAGQTDCLESKFLPWDDHDDYIRIEFDKVDS